MRTVPLLPNQHYHIYNRGVDKQPIFFLPENWSFFLRRLRQYFTSERASIIAYCLMPNHYHLLVQTKTDDFSKTVMQPFTVSYTKAINRQQNRVGPLFQGPFQARLIEREHYLLELATYIHLNPVISGLVPAPEAWEYSSFRDYIGLRMGTLPQPEIVLSRFTDSEAYSMHINERQGKKPEIPEELFMDS